MSRRAQSPDRDQEAPIAYQFRGNTAANQRTTTGPAPPRRPTPERRSLAQLFALVFGLTFLVVAVAGFVPGVTTPFEHLDVAGTESDAELLGVFRVSVLQNMVHLLFGVGLIAATRESWSLAYLLGGGLAYVGIAAYGFLIDQDGDANFLPVNTADNVLHTALALGLLGSGLLALAASRRHRRA